MIKAKAQRRKSTAKRITGKQAGKPDSFHDGDWYHPEFAEWFEAGTSDEPKQTHVFGVHHDTPGMDRGLVAFITIPESFSAQEAKRIARLMSSAPALWRLLHEAAPSVLEGSDGIAEFGRCTEELWDACGRYPYPFPSPYDDDEKSLAKEMRVRGVRARSRMDEDVEY